MRLKCPRKHSDAGQKLPTLGVVRYLIGTRDAGLVYGPDSRLVGYADADFGGDTESR